MRIKDLYKRNTICVSDGCVRKTVHMPLAALSRRFSTHEAQTLQALEALGFQGAPRLIRHDGDTLVMTRVPGQRLDRQYVGDRELFAALARRVEALHVLGFAHGNLSRDNVLVDEGKGLHLIDFETSCSARHLAFPVMRRWDYLRLYRLSQRVFGLSGDDVRAIFGRRHAWLISVARPVYALSFLVRRAKRGLRRVIGDDTRRRH